MAAESDLIAGTITLTNGSDEFTGVGTSWLLSGGRAGDTVIDLPGTPYQGVVKEITSDTAGILTKPWDGPTLTSAYRYRFQPDGSRVPAEARNLIELLGNGNLQAMAGLTGSASTFAMFTGPGAMILVPKGDLISGVAVDRRLNTMAERSAYDGQADQFSVYVADVGDAFGPENAGRSATFFRAGDTVGVWSDPAYVTGPIGETPEITIGSVTTGAPGTDAEVTATPTVDGVELDFTIPAGEGFVFEGAYDGGTAYALGDVVRDAGSSWIALQPTTGNAPPTLPSTSNAYWELMAQKGQDGTGTGDVVGPASSTAKRLLIFADASGKLLDEASGLNPAQQGQARADIDGGVLTGFVELLINGMGQVNQRAYTTVADDTYWCDRHYVLTQTAAITPTIISDVANGLPSMMRLSQSQATAQRMGNAQIVEASIAKAMRGKKVTLAGKLRCSSAQAIRFAILEWTGTADAVTSDVVSSWTNGTFAAGQFFLGSNLTVAGVGTLTPSAATLTDFELVVDVSASCNNLIVLIWTEGTAAQNVTLDHAWNLLPGDWSAGGWPYVNPRHPQQEAALCERYYRAPALSGLGWWNDATNFYIGMTFSPPMRATPTPGTPTGSVEELGSATRAVSAAVWSTGQSSSGGLLRLTTAASAGSKTGGPSSVRVPFDAEL